jgi:hypothetical protein
MMQMSLPCLPVRGVSQNAECVGLFPLPVARPGFYPLSLEEYVSCVPADACPGVDTSALLSAASWPAGNGTLRYVWCQTLRPQVCAGAKWVWMCACV